MGVRGPLYETVSLPLALWSWSQHPTSFSSRVSWSKTRTPILHPHPSFPLQPHLHEGSAATTPATSCYVFALLTTAEGRPENFVIIDGLLHCCLAGCPRRRSGRGRVSSPPPPPQPAQPLPPASRPATGDHHLTLGVAERGASRRRASESFPPPSLRLGRGQEWALPSARLYARPGRRSPRPLSSESLADPSHSLAISISWLGTGWALLGTGWARRTPITGGLAVPK